MRYEGTVYRPPSEAGSLLIQATIGCPHNKCTFCAMYKNTKFRVRPVEEIKEDLLSARQYYGDIVESIFFPDGNTIVMKTEQLIEIFSYAHELFSRLKRITVYGSARFVDKKSEQELKALHQAGLTRVHTGMESGDNTVLEKIRKGTTSEQIIRAGLKLKSAGIEVSEYYLVGIGGKDLSHEHAVNSAKTLNAFSPEFIRLRTYIPVPFTPLYDDYTKGKFKLLSPHEALREVYQFIENLECKGSMVLSDHVSNYWNVHGKIPDKKDKMLKEIEYALTIDESKFRPPHIGRL
ncbi:radical SAM protein [Thermosyntropha sp.]|uniref:radical SAM protein n=1 Tax=Thermosyntropha sp. TaxID=2740820 RepID=UPI0025E708F9|nr:radical SAM protein [Thermosyntropha sp.]MBO8159849.1 radical SAM protein [Thermosyntropha sp.]